MKSTFFHVGVNRTMARAGGLKEPYLDPDGSIPFVPLPNHHDPDFDELTYGDPWGRLNKFDKGDVAWFIESGSSTNSDWGYYLVAFFVIDEVYAKSGGNWSSPVRTSHLSRIIKNAHEIRGDQNYAIILGNKDHSKLLFSTPLQISLRQDPFHNIKIALGLPVEKEAIGYWFKKWFQNKETTALLRIARRHSSGV